MNDMRTKQWFVKVHYNGTLLEVKEIWSDTERMASIYAHKLAETSLDTQIETPEETKKRITADLIAELEAKLSEARTWDHEWPEYMDNSDEDRAKRRRLRATIQEWSTRLCDIRQTYNLKYEE